ncbi:MFS transporter [Nocardiopsis sp. JB363]|uniref:MFS transporter n=1 Tax=Nocardiopsis sp. JB363 TaxID=1434837 RepID=UPI00097AE972|nr:MFS transporter [Nocardiopsis sp. JB363]SIO88367.1 sugar transporter family protein [Nocardiopsis sp. JB363]
MLVRNRWVILSISMVAQVASVSAIFGIPVVLPRLREDFGVSTAQAGVLAGLPSFGLLLTLLIWGLVIDRVGERGTMALSLTLTAGALGLLWVAPGLWSVAAVFLLLGAVGGPVNAASGRLVLTWFAANERGLAMGIRQSGLPVGVGLSALVLPAAAEAWGFVGAMTLPALLALAAVPLVLAMPTEPPRTEPSRRTPAPGQKGAGAPPRSPYREWTIWRVHGVSMLLGVPQVTLMTYAVLYLVQEQGWGPPAAGAVIAAAQVPGAVGRLVLGAVSDRSGARMRPVRALAVSGSLVLLLLTLLPAAWPWSAVPLVLVCLVLTMWHNGLTFTAVAEIAGTAWAGRALAVQNWLQAISTTLTPLLMAAVITVAGLPWVFAVSAVFAAAAIAVVPSERRPDPGGATSG